MGPLLLVARTAVARHRMGGAPRRRQAMLGLSAVVAVVGIVMLTKALRQRYPVGGTPRSSPVTAHADPESATVHAEAPARSRKGGEDVPGHSLRRIPAQSDEVFARLPRPAGEG
jgi:hypothetical protein